MKKTAVAMLCALLFFSAQQNAFAQVQIDKDLQLIGTPGNRDITGAETVDASVGYLFNGSVGTAGQVLRSNGSSGFVAASLIASDIPNLDASKITTGVFSVARIPDLDMSKITTGNLDWSRISGAPAFAPASGSANYIQNQLSAAQSANAWISGTFRAANIGAGMAPGHPLDVTGHTRLTKTGAAFTTPNSGQLEVFNGASGASGGAAFISFHRGGIWGAHFGLDTDNWFSTQGWSAGSGYTNLRAGHIRGTGDVFADGIVYWGNSGSRTETRHDAGLIGSLGARSGFYETSAPAPAANWPAGASNWWHLLDVRHNNNSVNYAMQFAGSFFDQRLFFRKTDNNAARAWSEIHNTAVFAETLADVDRGTSTAIHTVLTTPNFEVRVGERYLITVVVDLRNNSGSGEDRWRIFLNRNNVSGCSTAEIGRYPTSDPESDHNTWHTYSNQFVWIANCSGTINLSLLVQRFDSDDSWRHGAARIIASRF